MNPDYIEARYNLALTFKSMNKVAAARKEYRTVLEVNPNIADAHADLITVQAGVSVAQDSGQPPLRRHRGCGPATARGPRRRPGR